MYVHIYVHTECVTYVYTYIHSVCFIHTKVHVHAHACMSVCIYMGKRPELNIDPTSVTTKVKVVYSVPDTHTRTHANRDRQRERERERER